MKLVKCVEGHFYDGDKYAVCPHCNGEEILVVTDKKKIVKCGRGHYYKKNIFGGCPVCKKMRKSNVKEIGC